MPQLQKKQISRISISILTIALHLNWRWRDQLDIPHAVHYRSIREDMCGVSLSLFSRSQQTSTLIFHTENGNCGERVDKKNCCTMLVWNILHEPDVSFDLDGRWTTFPYTVVSLQQAFGATTRSFHSCLGENSFVSTNRKSARSLHRFRCDFVANSSKDNKIIIIKKETVLFSSMW